MTENSATRTETNREIIRQAFDAWRQGTGAITDVFAPNMVLAYRGHSAASKEYRSRQQFIDEVLAPFGARFTVSEPFRPVTIRAVYADDVTDRPRAQVRRLGQLLLRQPRLGPQLPQQPGETQRSLLRHQPSIPSAQPRKPAPRVTHDPAPPPALGDLDARRGHRGAAARHAHLDGHGRSRRRRVLRIPASRGPG